MEFVDPREWWVAQSFVNQNQQFFIGYTENVTHQFTNGLLHPPYETLPEEAVIVDESEWDGSDFFHVIEYPAMLISERAVDVLDNAGLSNWDAQRVDCGTQSVPYLLIITQFPQFDTAPYPF